MFVNYSWRQNSLQAALLALLTKQVSNEYFRFHLFLQLLYHKKKIKQYQLIKLPIYELHVLNGIITEKIGYLALLNACIQKP